MKLNGNSLFIFRLLALCLPAVSCVPLKRNTKLCKDFFAEESRPCCNFDRSFDVSNFSLAVVLDDATWSEF